MNLAGQIETLERAKQALAKASFETIDPTTRNKVDAVIAHELMPVIAAMKRDATLRDLSGFS